MSLARLDASLLARKGTALPITNAYGTPLLDPIPLRRENARRRRSQSSTPRCRLRQDLHARLRILAARQGRHLGAVLELAVTDYLAANGEGCPCLRDGAAQPGPDQFGTGCCQANRREPAQM